MMKKIILFIFIASSSMCEAEGIWNYSYKNKSSHGVKIPDIILFLGISNIHIAISNLTDNEIFYGYTGFGYEDGRQFNNSNTRPINWNGSATAFLGINFNDKLEFHSYSKMDNKWKWDVMIVTSKKHNIQLLDYSVESNDQNYLPSWNDKVWSKDPLQVPITSFDGINWHSQYFLI